MATTKAEKSEEVSNFEGSETKNYIVILVQSLEEPVSDRVNWSHGGFNLVFFDGLGDLRVGLVNPEDDFGS